MANQPNVVNQLINPLYVQTFQRYLPTAFDEGFTLLEKMNKVITSLNQIGMLSNNVLDQWNQVMDWVMADGLDAAIDSKIDSMLQDGSLATIIGNAITDLGNEIGTLSNLNTNDKSNLVNSINELLNDITTFESTVNSNNTTAQTNLNNTLANIQFYGTPEQYGAKGDGVTDDTTAIQNALNACMITQLKQGVTYKVTKTLTLPKFHSINGNHAELKVVDSFTGNSIGVSVPAYTILYMQPRSPVFQEELSNMTQFVKDLRITGNTSYSSMKGMYLGVADQSTVSQATSVNFSVMGALIKNVSISQCNDGLILAEVWQSNFENVQTSYLSGNALSIQGQSVNNTFTGCFFSTASQGVHGVYITHGTYNGSVRRPEGNTFIGGYIGSTQIGVRIVDSFVTKFSNVIMDINSTYAVLIDNANGNVTDDAIFESCYMYSSGSLVVNIGDSTTTNLSIFKNCNFTGATDNALVGQHQNAIFDGCQGTNKITYASNSLGSVINGIWNQITTSNPQIIKNGANIFTQNNQFKLDGSAVVAA